MGPLPLPLKSAFSGAWRVVDLGFAGGDLCVCEADLAVLAVPRGQFKTN